MAHLARTRLTRLEIHDGVALALRRGHEVTSIADWLDVTVEHVRRVERGLANEPDLGHSRAEELILRATVDGTDRRALVEDLGGLPDSGDVELDLADARRQQWLSRPEEEQVRVMWHARRHARRDGWSTARETSTNMRAALGEDDELWLFELTLAAARDLRQIIKGLPDLLFAWQAAPEPVGTPWDEVLAAMIGHEFDLADLTAPAWTSIRVLTEDWTPEDDQPHGEVRRDTPDWLAARHILIRASHLERPFDLDQASDQHHASPRTHTSPHRSTASADPRTTETS